MSDNWSEKLPKCPHEFVIIFQITFVFPMQVQAWVYIGLENPRYNYFMFSLIVSLNDHLKIKYLHSKDSFDIKLKEIFYILLTSDISNQCRRRRD